MRYPRLRFALWLAEGHLRRRDRAAARPLIEGVLATSREMGYLHFEGAASWLMGKSLAPEAPVTAELYVETAIEILGRIGAHNNVARALVTRAALHQSAGDAAAARRSLDHADAIFQALGTVDEPARIAAARAALARGEPMPLVVGGL